MAKSPSTATPALRYEQGWGAINELVRSDYTWSGYERNIFYLNNRDGTFSDISGAAGLDFPDDSRTFVLADLDHDGRLELILKNRNAPQLRILHNTMKEIGGSVAFRLRGKKSNRDAIGSAVTVEAEGQRQTKYLQAGTGFLAQHSKELFFGVGKFQGALRATISQPWLQQVFENLPSGHRIEIEENTNCSYRRLDTTDHLYVPAPLLPIPYPLPSRPGSSGHSSPRIFCPISRGTCMNFDRSGADSCC